MSEEGSKRTVMLTVDSEDSSPGSVRFSAVDTVTGEKMDLLGVNHATICISPLEPIAVHLEVTPDKVNVAAVLEHVEGSSDAPSL